MDHSAPSTNGVMTGHFRLRAELQLVGSPAFRRSSSSGPAPSSRCLAPFCLVVALAAAAPGLGGEAKAECPTDEQGRKHGLCKELHENGKLKSEATYRHGALHGTSKSYYETGRGHISAEYADGKLHGKCQEYDEKGTLLKAEVWREGWLAFPRTSAQVRETLQALSRARVDTVGKDGTERRTSDLKRVQAVRNLMTYRFLCDVPYEGMKLSDELNEMAQAGAEILERLGRLDHNPPNPGLPEDRYQLGLKGTQGSCLHQGPDVANAIHGYMDDSDPKNISRGVGHRRWCLSPPMLLVGTASKGAFSAFYNKDKSRKDVPDWDSIVFPCRGYMPTDLFKPSYAWSVSLNRAKFAVPTKDSAKVTVTPTSQGFTKARTPLKLDFFDTNDYTPNLDPAIVFRPAGLRIANGARYLVEVAGISTKDGQPAEIKYLVEFLDLDTLTPSKSSR